MLLGGVTPVMAQLRIPGLASDDMPFRAAQAATTVAFITVPLGVLLLLLARVLWRGKHLDLIAGYKKYGVSDPKRMGRLMGALVGTLGVYQLIFPLTVRLWAQAAFLAFIFVIVGVGVAILIAGGYFERG
ncbi:MAG: hypothetical protein JXB46_02535 [Candidatus Eisenbacteria bacterium]|nr:hypothetical protein [Candidatus Eisenbacteria bacterium]